MRRFLRHIFLKPVLWLSGKYSSRPDKQRIFDSLSALLLRILNEKKKKGLLIPFELSQGKFIVFSDMHKGGGTGADDFIQCEESYLAALDYYYQNGFHLIALGDCEELWENSLTDIRKTHPLSFEREKKFVPANAFIKIFGNHDLYWDNDPLATFQLKEIYGYDVPIHEGVVLQAMVGERTLNIFCTHGHQGDAVSDGNWFSKFFVSRIWAPFQAYLKVNPNTPAYNSRLKTLHNTIMYDWSAQQQDLLLITGHTHQPVFESLTHIERLYRQLQFARKQNDEGMIGSLQKEITLRKFQYDQVSADYLNLRPSYFNSGCCCYNDGVITGIEISEGALRLIKWCIKNGKSQRVILEESPLTELMDGLGTNFEQLNQEEGISN